MRRRFPFLAMLVVLAAAALSGCTTLGPDYQRPDTTLPLTFRTDIDNGADLANSEWWQAFGDPDLNRLIDSAIDANKDLMIAAARVDEFNAQLKVSRAALYPQVGYTISASTERRSQERPNGLQPGRSPDVENYELASTFSWELDLWGRIKRSNEAALAELLATQETRRGVMLTLVSAVGTGYVQLLELDARLAITRRAITNREDALKLLDERWRGGSGTRLVVEQARAELETTRAEIPQLEREIALAENALALLAGRNPGHIDRRRLDTLKTPELPLGTPTDLLARRPDVMAAEQTLIAANARIGVAKAAYFPTLSLTAALGLGADDPSYLFAETARTGNVGAALFGSIFNAGRVEGGVRAAEAVQKQSLVRYAQTVQTALREVDDALVTRRKSSEREAALGRQIGALQDVVQLARLRYEGGQSTLIDVLDADLRLTVSQSGQQTSRRDTMLAVISVYRSMGGGWMLEQELRRTPPPPPEPPPQSEIQPEALQ